MIFKKNGERYKIFRYAGYDTEKKASIIEYVGSIGIRRPWEKVSCAKGKELSAQEEAEVRDYLESKRKEIAAQEAAKNFQNFPAAIKAANTFLCSSAGHEALNDEWAAAFWEAISTFSYNMNQRNFGKKMVQQRKHSRLFAEFTNNCVKVIQETTKTVPQETTEIVQQETLKTVPQETLETVPQETLKTVLQETKEKGKQKTKKIVLQETR